MKILMVCLGNICRSPMAEGILRNKVEQSQLNISVDSAGTSSYHIDESPDERATATMKENGINISNLRGREFTAKDFEEFDKIFVMDYSNYENVMALARNSEEEAKVEMILNLIYPNENRSVPDPYFGGDEGFKSVYKMLNASCDALIRQINEDD